MALGGALEVVHAQRPLDLAGQARPARERGCYKGRFVVPAKNCEFWRVLHHVYRPEPAPGEPPWGTVNPPNGGGSQAARRPHGLVAHPVQLIREASAVGKREVWV